LIAAAFAVAIASGAASAQAATPSPTPTASANPEALARAKTWFAALQNAKIDRSQLTDDMNKMLTEQSVDVVSKQISPLGAPVTFEQIQTGSQSGSSYYVYNLGFKNGDHLNFVFAVDSTGKVSGLRVLPPQ
jgi:hypothetical protein